MIGIDICEWKDRKRGEYVGENGFGGRVKVDEVK